MVDRRIRTGFPGILERGTKGSSFRFLQPALCRRALEEMARRRRTVSVRHGSESPMSPPRQVAPCALGEKNRRILLQIHNLQIKRRLATNRFSWGIPGWAGRIPQLPFEIRQVFLGKLA
jgi:hypothetical protein